MKKLKKTIGHAERKCNENGSRLTPKRKQVLTALATSPKALSAYEVVERCKVEFDQTIPVMSVYRILDFLEAEGFAHKLHLANKYVACAHISCDHAHDVSQFLICGQCFSVKEVSVEASILAKLQETVLEANFHLVSPQLEVSCICHACYKKPA